MAERSFICPKTQEACPAAAVCEPAKAAVDAEDPLSQAVARLWRIAPEVADAYNSGYCIDERVAAVSGVAANTHDAVTKRWAITALTDLDVARARAQA